MKADNLTKLQQVLQIIEWNGMCKFTSCYSCHFYISKINQCGLGCINSYDSYQYMDNLKLKTAKKYINSLSSEELLKI